MKKIVYYSSEGHTKSYAEMLGQELNLEVVPFSEIKKINQDDEIIFMSWVFANNIKKIKPMLKKYNIICAIAVGMNCESDKNIKLLTDTNNISIPFFYLQGGVDYKKVKGFKGKLIKMVAETVIRENKPEDKVIIEAFKNGHSFVCKENITKVVEHLR